MRSVYHGSACAARQYHLPIVLGRHP
jgi:hypothetical protein